MGTDCGGAQGKPTVKAVIAYKGTTAWEEIPADATEEATVGQICAHFGMCQNRQRRIRVSNGRQDEQQYEARAGWRCELTKDPPETEGTLQATAQPEKARETAKEAQTVRTEMLQLEPVRAPQSSGKVEITFTLDGEQAQKTTVRANMKAEALTKHLMERDSWRCAGIEYRGAVRSAEKRNMK
jgi:site-specific DNA-cytosine methylase